MRVEGGNQPCQTSRGARLCMHELWREARALLIPRCLSSLCRMQRANRY